MIRPSGTHGPAKVTVRRVPSRWFPSYERPWVWEIPTPKGHPRTPAMESLTGRADSQARAMTNGLRRLSDIYGPWIVRVHLEAVADMEWFVTIGINGRGAAMFATSHDTVLGLTDTLTLPQTGGTPGAAPTRTVLNLAASYAHLVTANINPKLDPDRHHYRFTWN